MPTPAEIATAYLDNADYDVSNNTAKARLFVTSARQILSLASRSRRGGQGTLAEHEFDLERVENQLNDALEWLVANTPAEDSTTGGIEVIAADFRPWEGRR